MRLVAFLVWTLALFATPLAAQDLTKLQVLEQRLAAMAAENPGEFGIAAIDLGSGEAVGFNADRPFPMASTMKLAVAAAYLSEVDAGRRGLDDIISGVPARTLMDRMITRSDNGATDMLIMALGGPATIDVWLHRHQLTGIRVDRTIAQLLSAKRDLRDVRDSSTPTAMLGLLRLIDSDAALTPSSRGLLLDMMRRCRTGSNRIRGLMPAGVRVENKTGTLSGYTGDVGYLTLADGRRIAVAFFARGGENRPAVIATAARAIYDAYVASPATAKAVPAIAAGTTPSAMTAPAIH